MKMILLADDEAYLWMLMYTTLDDPTYRILEAADGNEAAERLATGTTAQLILYARGLKRSVDAERHKTRALAEVNARLALLDRLQPDFLSFIAHELRTPLTGMAASTPPPLPLPPPCCIVRASRSHRSPTL